MRAKLRERLNRSYPGGRRAWGLALLPFVPKQVAPTAASAGIAGGALIPGALVMSAKVKLGLVVTLVLLLSGAVWRVSTGDRELPPTAPETPDAPSPPPAVAEVDPGEDGDSSRGGPGGGDAPRRHTEVVAENARIEGFVRHPDGSPAPGVFVRSSFRGHFRVDHSSCYAVTRKDGGFSFPAVRGGPYSVSLMGGQPGLLVCSPDCSSPALADSRRFGAETTTSSSSYPWSRRSPSSWSMPSPGNPWRSPAGSSGTPGRVGAGTLRFGRWGWN